MTLAIIIGVALLGLLLLAGLSASRAMKKDGDTDKKRPDGSGTDGAGSDGGGDGPGD